MEEHVRITDQNPSTVRQLGCILPKLGSRWGFGSPCHLTGTGLNHTPEGAGEVHRPIGGSIIEEEDSVGELVTAGDDAREVTIGLIPSEDGDNQSGGHAR